MRIIVEGDTGEQFQACLVTPDQGTGLDGLDQRDICKAIRVAAEHDMSHRAKVAKIVDEIMRIGRALKPDELRAVAGGLLRDASAPDTRGGD